MATCNAVGRFNPEEVRMVEDNGNEVRPVQCTGRDDFVVTCDDLHAAQINARGSY